MLSIENVSLSMGRSYYQKDNYYTKEESSQHSMWYGKLKDVLNLQHEVDFKQFDNLLFGYNPDGTKNLSDNSIDPKKYQEPHISKTEKGSLEFVALKIAEKYQIEDEIKEKISNILQFQMRFNKKIKKRDYNECMKSIEKTLKTSENIRGKKRDEVLELYSQAVSKITRPTERRGGYDLTFCAPKSVSIVALVHNDKEVLQAHRKAVLKALDEVERNYAKTRIGGDAKREIENAKKLLMATFEHDMSRDLDPHLHTHSVIFNLIQREDGEWRSLHADDFRTFSKYIGMVYQNELAHEIKKLGYEIEVNQNGTFEIRGIPAELKEHFSKRRNFMVKELGVTDQKSARDLVKVERVKKSDKIDREKEYAKWKFEERIFNYDRKSLKNNHYKAVETKEFQNKNLIESYKDALNQAGERNIIFDLENAKMNHIQNNFGRYTFEELMQPFENAKEDLQSVQVKNGNKYITKDSLEVEEKTIEILNSNEKYKNISEMQRINEIFEERNLFDSEKKKNIILGINDILNQNQIKNIDDILKICENNISSNQRLSSSEYESISDQIINLIELNKIKKAEKKDMITEINVLLSACKGLNEGQKNAIQTTLLSEDRNIIWEGVAGAGKTYSLKIVIEEAKKAGYEIKGLAQNADAATILSAEAGIQAQTVDSLVCSKLNSSADKKLWIVDEAGLISGKLGYELVKKAEAENARMVIVGGISQLSAPTSGHFLKLAKRFTNVKTVQLDESVRQKNKELALGVKLLNAFDLQRLDSVYYKNTAQELSEKAMFHFKGFIEEFKTEEARISNAARYFLSLDEEELNKTILVAQTHSAIENLTNTIREKLFERGYLKNEIETKTYLPVQLNKNQTKYALNYEIGNIITTENSKTGIKANEIYFVRELNTIRNTLTIEDISGNKYKIKPEHIKDIQQYKERTIKIAENDWMSWRKNSKDKSRLNKQMFKILEIDKEQNTAKIKYEKGHEEIINLKGLNYMSHSWAVTYNASQGATKKHTVGIIEPNCGHEQIYTVFTRATHTLKIFAESKESIQKSLLKSKSNLTATEIVSQEKEKKYVLASKKMDFYDKNQKFIVMGEKQKAAEIQASIAAPSDLSAYYFTADNLTKKKLMEIQEKSIKTAIDKFSKYLSLNGNISYEMISNDTLFNRQELSEIQYIHTDLNFKSLLKEDGSIQNLNQFSFIENQKTFKHMYEAILADNLSNELKLTVTNDAGILRIKEKNNHVHAIFAEHFQLNVERLKFKKEDKFLSPFEIKQKINNASSILIDKNQNILKFDNIVQDIPNQKIEIAVKLSEKEIVQNALIHCAQDLQIFDETMLYQALLMEAKGNIETEKIDSLMLKLLTHEELKFLTYDRFGKMLFCFNTLNNEEAIILKHSVLRKNENHHSLNFERVMRRIENLKLTNDEISAFLHISSDHGGVKFIDRSYSEFKEVVNQAIDLYKSSDYHVIQSYAGRASKEQNSNSELHIRKLLESIEEKRTVIDEKTVLIIKDIGNNISSSLSKVFEHAESAGAKVICFGDKNDFLNLEEKRFLKDMNRTSGVTLNLRYEGYLKQKGYYISKDNDINKSTEKLSYFSQEEQNNKNIENILDESEKQRLLVVMEKVQDFYSKNLFSENGKEALNYLLNERKFTIEDIQKYKIGLAESYGLEAFAKENNISKEDLVKLSLLVRKDDGKTYDFYRRRILIPINNSEGKCIGFGGRIYKKEDIENKISKYINPKSTILFDKSKTLFGLDRAIESIKENKEVIVVEGYLDQLALDKSGIKNSVAVLGTALTKVHVENLKSYTNEVTLFFDNDKAGKMAMKRSFQTCSDFNMNLNYSSLNNVKDVDEYLKFYKREEFIKEFIDNKVPLDQFISSTYETNEIDYNQINLWKKEVLPHLFKIKDPIERSLAIKSASQYLKVPINILVGNKSLKYIDNAFLSEGEIKEKNNMIIQNYKKDKLYENNKISKERIKKWILNEEYMKIVRIPDDTVKNVKIEEIKNILDFNIDYLKNKLLINGNTLSELEIYKLYLDNYKESNIYEVYDLINKEIVENSANKNIFNMYNDTLNLMKETDLSKYENIGKLSEKQRSFELYKYFYDDSEKKEESKLNIQEFEKYLEKRKMIAYTKELDLKSHECIIHLIDNKSNFKEIEELLKKLDSLTPFYSSEILSSSIQRNFPQYDKQLSLEENMRKMNEFTIHFKKSFSEDNNFRNNIIEDINSKYKLKKYEYANEIDSKKEQLEKGKVNHVELRKTLKKFENDIKESIKQKLDSGNNIEKIFQDVRKILIKEAKYNEKENTLESYFDLARNNKKEFVDSILKDFKFKENHSLKVNVESAQNTDVNLNVEDLNTKQEFDISKLYKQAGISLNDAESIANDIILSNQFEKEEKHENDNLEDLSIALNEDVFDNKFKEDINVFAEHLEISEIDKSKYKKEKVITNDIVID